MTPTETFPAAFRTQMEQLLPASECLALLQALETPSPVSIRFNPFKVSSPPRGRQVPWCRYGYYLDQRPAFTLDPIFHAGAYYVQEASSMFIEALYRDTMNQEPGQRVLDLCASPGGKTTLLSTLVGPEGLVVANEVIRQRALTLVDNVKKWGVGNVIVTQNDPTHFTPFEHFFDLILVDAPCSGEGMFRKNEAARSEWSEANVKLCAARSRRILSDVWGCLRPGGVMLLSTCTFNPQENEETVRWLTQEYDVEGVELQIDPTWGIQQTDVEGIPTFRFYPHRLTGEGFFAAALRKADGRTKTKTPKPRKEIFTDLRKGENEAVAGWFNQPEYMRFSRVGVGSDDNIHAYYRTCFSAIRALSENLTVLYSGILTGQLFGTKLRPEHPLALFHDLNRQATPTAELPLEAVLDYLRKGDVAASELAEGINLITYQGLPVGWVKRIGARCNNMYPKEFRISNL